MTAADTPEVSIIIPVYNRVELTRQCLEAVYRTAPPGRCEVIVVDNGSTDDTPAYLSAEAAAGRVVFVRKERNLGFARACNLGAARARGRYLLFLNNDTIPTPGWVEALLKASALPDVGIVGAKLLYPDGAIQHAGVVFRRGGPDHIHRFAPADAPEASRLRDLDMVTGACLLIPRDLFLGVGGFDETFLNGFEDVDLCLRVRALGRRVVYQPEAVVYHLESRSEGRRDHELDNFAEFRRRWWACFGRGGRFAPDKAPPENLVSRRSLLLNPAAALRAAIPPVVWQAPLFGLSGYAEEARQFVLGLYEAGVPVKAVPLNWGESRVKLPPEEALILARLSRIIDPPGRGRAIGVFHAFPDTYRTSDLAGTARRVIRTMFETDRIPAAWVEVLKGADRVWVPSSFNFETFAESGIDPEKLTVIPSPTDIRPFARPAEPLDILGRRGFNFLSVLDFQLRKGWDVLVRAFAAAFRPDDDVALILKIWSYRGISQARIRNEVCRLLGRELPPNIILYFKELGTDEMPRLYAAADAFVLATRGEGFGRPAAEAMAAGLPVIITGWGGHRDFATPETAYLIDYEVVPVPEAGAAEVPLYRGQRWAEPSAEHLAALMREVVLRPEPARAKAELGRRKVLAELNRKAVAEKVIGELAALGGAAPGRSRRIRTPPEVAGAPAKTTHHLVWEGDFETAHSYARVNRELVRALGRAGVRVARLGRGLQPPARPALWVRHRWPPDFDPPAEAPLAVIQPWEYGAVPRAWVEGINRGAEELWVPSRFVRDCFVEGGVPADRVFIIPNGVDTGHFRPGARPLDLAGLKPGLPELGSRLRFLFVGGVLWRKGIDILLRAYAKAFGPKDDVALIIKDVGAGSFYRGQSLRTEVRRFEAEAAGGKLAPVIYIDRELPDEALPGLYAACHCLVHPFRGEGFGLPVAEAMACGLPVIATGAGPVPEFADETTAYLIPARPTYLKGPTIDGLDLVGWPWVFEPDEEALVELLRRVHRHYAEARRKGEAAARRVRATLTWDHSARRVIDRVASTAAEGGDAPARRGRRPPVLQAVATAPPEAAPLISLCMIVKDGAKDLPRCLESVRGIADEVIVVDTGSTDGTPEVARSFGAKVVFFPWTGSFADARNESLRHARGRWILILDADEALGRGKQNLREAVSAPSAPDGFLLPQVTYLGIEPGSADAVVVPALRLFKNLPGLKFGRRLHEQILESLGEVRPAARVGVLEVEIEHYGYLASGGKVPEKHRRNLELARQELAERPSDAFAWFNLGQEYYAAGRWEAALFCFRRAIRYLPGDYRMWLPRAVELAAHSALKLGRFGGALKLLEEATRGLGDHPNLRLLEGQARLGLGDVAGARRAFAAALKAGEAGPPAFEIRNEGAAGYAAWYWLGRCAELEGRRRDALLAFAESVRLSLAAGRRYRPAVEALVRHLLPAARSGQEFVTALKRLVPELSGALAVEAARAVFAEPPVPAAGLAAAEMLLALGPDGRDPAEVWGLLRLFRGEYAGAAAAFGAAGNGSLRAVAAALAGRGDLAATLAPALETVGDGRAFLSWVLGLLLQRGEFEQFEGLLLLAERVFGDPSDRALALGRLYCRFGFWDLAVETLAPPALTGTLDGEGLSLLATALEKTGNLEAAEEVWLEVAQKDPRSLSAARAYAALAAVRLGQGRPAEAEQLLELAGRLMGW